MGVGFGIRAVDESKNNVAAAKNAAAFAQSAAPAVDMSTATSMVHLTEFKIDPGVVTTIRQVMPRPSLPRASELLTARSLKLIPSARWLSS